MVLRKLIPTLVPACAVLLLAGDARPAAAQDAARGAALLVEAKKALGGEDKLAAIQRLEVKGVSRRAGGNQTLESDFEMLIELPDKFRMKEETFLPGGSVSITRIQGLNGAEVWDATEGGNLGFGGGRGGGRGGGALAGLLGGAQQGQAGRGQVDPEALLEAQRRQRQADLARYLLTFLLTTTEPTPWIGTGEAPDGTADVLEVKGPDGQATRLFLDTTTHMPLMLAYAVNAPRQANPAAGGGRGGRRGGGAPGQPAPGQGPQQGEAPAQDAAPAQGGRGGGAQAGGGAPQAMMEVRIAEYKVVNGVKLPHVVTRGINGELQEELAIKSFKINPNFKSNTFTQPK